MSERESFGSEYPGRDFFGWEKTGGELPGRNCRPGGFVREGTVRRELSMG